MWRERRRWEPELLGVLAGQHELWVGAGWAAPHSERPTGATSPGSEGLSAQPAAAEGTPGPPALLAGLRLA